MRILPIVEGDGDMEAVPELVRRVLHAHERYDVEISRPHRRGDLPKVLQRFDDYLQTALIDGDPVLWVLDYDCEDCDDDKRDLVDLVSRSASLRGSVAVEFVFFVKEFESIFLADHETTKAVFEDIPSNFQFPIDPESVRDAKGWISKARPKGAAYKPTQHQKRLASRVDLGRLRCRSPSFRRFEAAVLRLALVS